MKKISPPSQCYIINKWVCQELNLKVSGAQSSSGFQYILWLSLEKTWESLEFIKPMDFPVLATATLSIREATRAVQPVWWLKAYKKSIIYSWKS